MPDFPTPDWSTMLAEYEGALKDFGDTAAGAGWPSEEARTARFEVFASLFSDAADEPTTLCDFGCGTGEFLGYLRRVGLGNVTYVGVDISPLALSYARDKFPDATFLELDVSNLGIDISAVNCDYLVANGVFTSKCGFQHDDEMRSFLASTLRRVWPHVKKGIAFNATLTTVDWRREDTFYLPMDDALEMLRNLAGPTIWIRADYAPREYTIFARREPTPSPATKIPVLSPLLPTTKALLHHLPRIERSRIYTNFGPLALELESKLGKLLGLPGGCFISASSGTAALVGGILGRAGRATRERPLAVIPAFTFVATALAAQQCGFEPIFADVDSDTWMLKPSHLDDICLDEVGLVIPVAPFGRPVYEASWGEFSGRTGIPVVVDAAASFDRLIDLKGRAFGKTPFSFSFHATKSFSTAEGGGVATTDRSLAEKILRALNFGFLESRECAAPSINGKMSEYHAAVGLAELDGWSEKQTQLQRVAELYRQCAKRNGLNQHFVTGPDVSLAYVLFHARDVAQAERVASYLVEAGIDYRRWYGFGLHQHPLFAAQQHPLLHNTEQLAKTILGLPLAPDLTQESIDKIVSQIAFAVEASA